MTELELIRASGAQDDLHVCIEALAEYFRACRMDDAKNLVWRVCAMAEGETNEMVRRLQSELDDAISDLEEGREEVKRLEKKIKELEAKVKEPTP